MQMTGLVITFWIFTMLPGSICRTKRSTLTARSRFSSAADPLLN